MKIELNSTITCLHCNYQKEKEMPLNSCLFVYQCETLIKPDKDDSCIFCSYGSITCPPVQENHLGHIEKIA
ncbi:MAG: GDCCVxC domain-containing (seleno)protein [Flavobacteriaceae bacterium]|nr:GDCCVxC domain-containing (seleno)protein [Flavobacteriaceae bacterium]